MDCGLQHAQKWLHGWFSIPCRSTIFCISTTTGDILGRRLGYVMVSVIPVGPEVSGFSPGRSRWIFKGDKIRGTPSFGGEVKPEAPCRKNLRHLKYYLQVWKNTSQSQIYHFLLPFLLLAIRRLLVGFPASSGRRIGSFPLSIPFHHCFTWSYITWGMNNRPLGGRSSET
jgi:hypothetical protein